MPSQPISYPVLNEEYAATARSLAADFRVIALDQRGHGRSTRHPRDLSREAFADDVAAVIADSGASTPVTLVGQSMGAHTALVTAGRHPGLASHLIMVEGDVGGGGIAALEYVSNAICAWPASFASYGAVRDFFGGDSPRGRAWADGYHEHDGRWEPWFDPQITRAVMAPVFEREQWATWDRLTARTDLVLAGRTALSLARIDRMCARRPQTRRITIQDAGHDLHLDQPAEWLCQLRELITSPPEPSGRSPTPAAR